MRRMLIRLALALLCALVPLTLFSASEAEQGQRAPLLYWPEKLETAAALKQAGIERICAPPERADAWRKAGFTVRPMRLAELQKREKLLTPRIAGRANVASATRRPWLDANGWRFLRNPRGRFYYDLPEGKAALAAAEAFAYNADAILKIALADLAELGRMLAFLKQLPADELPPVADLGVLDDGSPELGEVLNLLVRRNLLFRLVKTPAPQYVLNIKLGTKAFPRAAAADPSEFVLRIRRQLGDQRRSLRVYGSELALGRLTSDGQRARVHLLNYSGREMDSLRVRVRGTFAPARALSSGFGQVQLEDVVVADGAIEFSLPQMGAYTVVELRSMH